MNLGDQIFHTLTAVSLKQAASIRPLTTSEKSLLEIAEARGGNLYTEVSALTERINDAGKK